MFYIHHTACISPQYTFPEIDFAQLNVSTSNKLIASEPSYKNIPTNILRRMGKAVRMAVGAAMPLLEDNDADGFIIGTANGGMEDCIKFLNQIISYNEGMLTPGNFVQSTPNAIASQISMLTGNKAYNITHVQRGLAFETAVIDAVMKVKELPGKTFLLGGVDEISSYNFNIDKLAGWYRQQLLIANNLYEPQLPGTVAGEAAAMFLVNDNAANAMAQFRGITTLHAHDEEDVKTAMQHFLNKYLAPSEKIDLFLTGENGDSRLLKYYTSCEALLEEDVMIARFKHLCGEYPTASAFALWLACQIIKDNNILPYLLKRDATDKSLRNIVIYNNYKGYQHSFMLLSV